MPLSMGNPGPIGLLSFIVTTMIDMYVTMGWVENGFDAYIVAYGFVYGGFTQWIAGILSVLRGDSYSGSLFTLYGGYWMAFGVVGMISADPTAEWAREEVKARMVHGIAGLKILFGVITFLYWTLSHRKTIILWLILPNVYMLLFLGAYSLLTGSEAAKVISGYFGFAASCLALYSFYGELVNEEYGRHVLPLMVPLFPISGLVTDQSIAERLSYDPKRNTLFVNFKDLTISSEQDIKTIVDGIRARVKQGAGDKKVKCVANYTDVSIRKDLIPAYWAAAQELGKQCYLSIERFNAEVFAGSKIGDGPGFSGLPYPTHQITEASKAMH